MDALNRTQEKLSISQMQLATGKKARSYAALGDNAVRSISARSMIARNEAYSQTARRVGTTLSLYDTNMSAIEAKAGDLRQRVLDAIAIGNAAGLQQEIESAFAVYRSSLNASEAGVPLFGGSRTDADPFVPQQLSDLIGLAPAAAFANDGVRSASRLGEDLEVTYGIGADEIGAGLFSAFRTLAEAGTIADIPTAAQMDALKQAVGELADGLGALRSVNADNGRRHASVEALGDRAMDRNVLLQETVSGNEDADLSKVAMELSQHKSVLESSYSVFAQLSRLSLAAYLK